MTQMTEAPPTPTPPPQLERHKQDRVWLGVCAAIGRSTGTDPVLWRVIVSVLTLFGGSGLLLYGAGWALIREEGEAEAPADRLLRRRAGRLTPGAIVLVILVSVVGLAIMSGVGWGFDNGPDLVPIAVVALLAYLVLKRRNEPFAETHLSYDVSPDQVPGDEPPRPKGPPVALLTASSALLVGGALVGLSAAGADGITAPRVCAAVLAVLGLGLVVGSRWGRQWTLITLALLTFGALNVTACLDIPFDASSGERTWVVAGNETHRLGAGDATLDLRQVAVDAAVKARVGAGRLEIVLPAETRVEVHAEVGAGVIDLPEQQDAADGVDLSLDRAYGPSVGPAVRVDVRVGLGNVVVSRG